jgi:hypothetical protein
MSDIKPLDDHNNQYCLNLKVDPKNILRYGLRKIVETIQSGGTAESAALELVRDKFTLLPNEKALLILIGIDKLIDLSFEKIDKEGISNEDLCGH